MSSFALATMSGRRSSRAVFRGASLSILPTVEVKQVVIPLVEAKQVTKWGLAGRMVMTDVKLQADSLRARIKCQLREVDAARPVLEAGKSSLEHIPFWQQGDASLQTEEAIEK